MVRIENWSLVPGSDDPYKAPEQVGMSLQGFVYGHPNRPTILEGEYVTTSRIVSANGRIVQTRNTTYELGTVDPDYLAWHKENYPDSQIDLESDSPLPNLE